MSPTFYPILISGILAAVASGLVGAFLITKRMTLMSDALSHVALPGIALGMLFNFQPLVGGLAFLAFAIIFIWLIETKTELATESITGVLFVTALAVGAWLEPEESLLEAFFGDVSKITNAQIAIQIFMALLIIGLVLKYLKPLTLFCVAPDLCTASKISKTKMQLLLLSLIALTISIGISFVGILLMSGLAIIPAAAAKNLSKNFKTFISLSAVLAVISLSGGLILSQFFKISPGIATVLISSLIFFVSLLATPKRNLR